MTAEQRDRDDIGVTEDDVMEIRQDISTLRFELIDILANNGMKTPRINLQDTTSKIIVLFYLNLSITGTSRVTIDYKRYGYVFDSYTEVWNIQYL